VTPLAGTYDPWLVAMSVLIAIFAAGAALDLAGRVTASRGQPRVFWLAGGALAMGLGIWSMHYTGMLAFRLPVPVLYHVPTALVSLAAAVLASAVALYVASRERLSLLRTLGGSLAMGGGIAAMHYTGMAAMRLPAATRWSAALVAVAVSAVALLLAFRFGQDPLDRWTWRKVSAACVMGLAIPSMHYTGMAAASFTSASGAVAASAAIRVSVLGTVAIAAATLIVLCLAIATSLVARYGEERLRISAALLREHERQLAEAQAIAHVGSWELEVATNRVTWSDEAYRLYGLPLGSSVGYDTFLDRLHPEDRERVERMVGEGLAQRRAIEFEFRIVRPDGGIRHLVGRNVVTIDAGGTPVRLAGTSLDITERKHAEEALRAALLEVKTLRGYLRVCATCRRVLTKNGEWEQIESYVRRHTEAEFSHGICPDCARQWGTPEMEPRDASTRKKPSWPES